MAVKFNPAEQQAEIVAALRQIADAIEKSGLHPKRQTSLSIEHPIENDLSDWAVVKYRRTGETIVRLNYWLNDA